MAATSRRHRAAEPFADHELVSRPVLRGEARARDDGRRPSDDPALHLRQGARLETGPHAAYWDALARLLESAYGYGPARACGRSTRQAPSAGAMYPLELVAIAPDAVGGLPALYSFEQGGFFEMGAVECRPLRQACAPGSAGTLLMLVSLFKRTARRYGVRGYRYCLLEGGAVLANLCGFARQAGIPATLHGGRTLSALDRLAGLRDSEASLAVLELRALPVMSFLPPLAPRTAASRHAARVVHAPSDLDDMLVRVARHHRDSLAFDAPPRAFAADGSIVLPALAGRRRSADDFADVRVDGRGMLARLQALWRDVQLPFGSPAAALTVHWLAFQPDGHEDGVFRADRAGGPSMRIETGTATPGGGAAALRNAFARACQGQGLVGRCAFAVVLSAPCAALREAPVYRHTVLNAGYLDFMHQLAALREGLGDSCVGGFDDAAVAAILGDAALRPLVIHVFGQPVAGVKIDACGDSGHGSGTP